MTTLPGRGNTALLVIDVQSGVIEGAVDRDLAISGAQTDQCIGATLHGAIVRGYDATPCRTPTRQSTCPPTVHRRRNR